MSDNAQLRLFGPLSSAHERDLGRPSMPLARDRDSVTSFLAAEKQIKSRRFKGQMRLTLLGVRRWPGRTSAEMAELLGISRYDTARRLPALEHRGLVKKGKQRFCTVCKSVCVTWITPEREKYPLLTAGKK